VLQWGRVIDDAEIWCRAGPPGSTCCFNGAASSMTRKSRCQSGHMDRRSLLQWGRVIDDAEMELHMSKRTKPVMLQWGRVIDDAEMGSRGLGRGQ